MISLYFHKAFAITGDLSLSHSLMYINQPTKSFFWQGMAVYLKIGHGDTTHFGHFHPLLAVLNSDTSPMPHNWWIFMDYGIELILTNHMWLCFKP